LEILGRIGLGVFVIVDFILFFLYGWIVDKYFRISVMGNGILLLGFGKGSTHHYVEEGGEMADADGEGGRGGEKVGRNYDDLIQYA
jgi:hypothetical protein